MTWKLETASGVGAVAIIGLYGADGPSLDRALNQLGLGAVPIQRVALRDLLGVDRGVVMRPSEGQALLMPHGGGAVVRRLGARLNDAGIAEANPPHPARRYPEASDEIEAAMLATLARAASPLAVDLLLDQPRRWRAHLRGERSDHALADAVVLRRLVEPALVVAIGASNIGKSTLANALAGRPVSLAADEAGTTRDHVGVMLDLGGLVIRYIDTPGIREDASPVESEAVSIARLMLERADLVLGCCDAGSELPAECALAWPERLIRVGLRSDLGRPRGGVDIDVSIHRPESVDALARAIRERLVPRAAVEHPGPWRFWNEGEVGGV